ncbi:SIS domain-containing protein [Thalassotalea sp. G2M2-11]|uniref:SIS domain-containing protein n=1 Tax=Thalassotalea sp. G2M2-11 TaxID=2787627 RepID=UPI0019D162DF|nr:SIS domain-containing protein [Thalassotalea sp. G2M2-11]
MNEYLTIDVANLKEKNAYWTAKEISQQPKVWREAQANVTKHKEAISAFLSPILARKNLRIILTGAGTSAYVGETIAPHISRETSLRCEAISTTEIVGAPEYYLSANHPTLLISFARSGNSPESLAAVELANQIVNDCFHLVLTCNENGKLAQGTQNKNNALSLIMPEGTLDESFAMTSSFTSMLVSALSIFTPCVQQLEHACSAAEGILTEQLNSIKAKAEAETDRIVFLGAGPLLGIAREAALKYLELTAGQVISYCESPLGFRHGPKSIVNNKTDIILFQSSNSYTRHYNQDLNNEVIKDNIAASVTCLDDIIYHDTNSIADVWAGLPIIVYCQVLAFYKSIALNLTPDNPCPTGEVNRVVQGVTIYPFDKNHD